MSKIGYLIFTAALCASVVLAVRDRRVVDGEATDIKEAPWLVQFIYWDGSSFDNTLTCTGSIINDRKILTAAHCVAEGLLTDPQNNLKLRVGATKKKEGGKVLAVDSVVKHPKFDDVSVDQAWDVAIVTTAEPIEFSDTVKPIEMTKKRISGDVKVRTGGWGSAEVDASQEPGSFAPGLKTVEMVSKSKKSCKNLVGRTTLPDEAKKTIICFTPKNGMTCVGDSGTGLWTPAKDGKSAKLYGVLHGVSTCDPETGFPLYLDVSAEQFQDFFDDNL